MLPGSIRNETNRTTLRHMKPLFSSMDAGKFSILRSFVGEKRSFLFNFFLSFFFSLSIFPLLICLKGTETRSIHVRKSNWIVERDRDSVDYPRKIYIDKDYSVHRAHSSVSLRFLYIYIYRAIEKLIEPCWTKASINESGYIIVDISSE